MICMLFVAAVVLERHELDGLLGMSVLPYSSIVLVDFQAWFLNI